MVLSLSDFPLARPGTGRWDSAGVKLTFSGHRRPSVPWAPPTFPCHILPPVTSPMSHSVRLKYKVRPDIYIALSLAVTEIGCSICELSFTTDTLPMNAG